MPTCRMLVAWTLLLVWRGDRCTDACVARERSWVIWSVWTPTSSTTRWKTRSISEWDSTTSSCKPLNRKMITRRSISLNIGEFTPHRTIADLISSELNWSELVWIRTAVQFSLDSRWHDIRWDEWWKHSLICLNLLRLRCDAITVIFCVVRSLYWVFFFLP